MPDSPTKAYKEYIKTITHERVPHYDTYLGKEEAKLVAEVVLSNWISEGKKTREFEERFRKFVGTKHAFATANCTGGLMIALRAIGVQPGDEVIVPTFTHMGSVACIALVGAKPVFVDVDPKTYTISPDGMKQVVTNRTKAAIVVHIYGHPADMDKIMPIADQHKISIIEDSAQGLGSRYKGIHVGNFGRAAGFSFFADKTVTTGEGGMLVTNDESLTKEILMLKNDGRIERGVYVSDRVGYNMRITDIQSALALPQLAKLNRLVARKRRLVAFYKKHLKGVRGVKFPYWDEHCFINPHRVNILVEDPESLMQYLQKYGMGARLFYHPVHRYPTYNTGQSFPNAEYAFAHGLSLPSAPMLEESTVRKVCEKVKEYMT